jgi:hypothetical protein
MLNLPGPQFGFMGAVSAARRDSVGAAEGCDLLILIFQVKRSQPAAAPTGEQC